MGSISYQSVASCDDLALPSILDEADKALIVKRWHLDDWWAHPALFHLREHTLAYINGMRSTVSEKSVVQRQSDQDLAHV
jgi:hypothetical protein